MEINREGIELIKSFEGLRLTAYKCPSNVLTIGYGHTGTDVKEDMLINGDYAEFLLKKDLEKFEKGVLKLLKKPATTNQFSAMVSLAYNIGLGNFAKSSVLMNHNHGNFLEAAKYFLLWNKAGGKVLEGLKRRRILEKNLYEKSY